MSGRKIAAFTYIELTISTAVAMLIMAALVSGAIAIQKSFAATDDYAINKCDQMRLTDYLALDLRRALTVTAGTGDTVVTLAIPDYYDAGGSPRTPSIAGQVVNYGDPAQPVIVVYSKSGGSIYRQQNAEPKVEIANNVDDFKMTVQDLDKVVKTQITFAPKYQQVQTADARVATTVFNTTLLRNKRRDH